MKPIIKSTPIFVLLILSIYRSGYAEEVNAIIGKPTPEEFKLNYNEFQINDSLLENSSLGPFLKNDPVIFNAEAQQEIAYQFALNLARNSVSGKPTEENPNWLAARNLFDGLIDHASKQPDALGKTRLEKYVKTQLIHYIGGNSLGSPEFLAKPAVVERIGLLKGIAENNGWLDRTSEALFLWADLCAWNVNHKGAQDWPQKQVVKEILRMARDPAEQRANPALTQIRYAVAYVATADVFRVAFYENEMLPIYRDYGLVFSPLYGLMVPYVSMQRFMTDVESAHKSAWLSREGFATWQERDPKAYEAFKKKSPDGCAAMEKFVDQYLQRKIKRK